MLFREAACEDKSLEWVDNVFHDLMHEKPTSDRVIESIVEWIGARIDGPVKPAGKKPKRAASKKKKRARRARVTRGAEPSVTAAAGGQDRRFD